MIRVEGKVEGYELNEKRNYDRGGVGYERENKNNDKDWERRPRYY